MPSFNSASKAATPVTWPRSPLLRLAQIVGIVLAIIMTTATAQSSARKDTVDAVLIGDSITWGGNWESRFPELRLVNRGVPGYKTTDVLNEMGTTIALRPKKAFLMIGINDLLSLAPVDQVYSGIVAIVRRLQSASIPVVMLATLECSRKTCVQAVDWVRELNGKLKAFALAEKIPFIDLNPKFTDPDSGLLPDFTWDGLHLSEPAYVIWADALRPHLKPRP